MGQFNGLWDKTWALLLAPEFNQPVTPLAVPTEYAEAYKPENDLRLHFDAIQLGQAGELRSARISAPKIEIINLFFFPRNGFHLPVYALELVKLGPRPLIGVMDLLDFSQVCPSRTIELMQTAHQLFPLPYGSDPPDWYLACRSGQDFFVRPRTEEELNILGQTHLFVWETLLKWINQAVLGEAREQEKLAVFSYKQHHLQHTPGLRLLNSSFGNDWSRQFLEAYLFS